MNAEHRATIVPALLAAGPALFALSDTQLARDVMARFRCGRAHALDAVGRARRALQERVACAG